MRCQDAEVSIEGFRIDRSKYLEESERFKIYLIVFILILSSILSGNDGYYCCAVRQLNLFHMPMFD